MPAAKVTACSSAIPTSKNRLGIIISYIMKTYPLTQTQLGIYLSETAAEGQGDYNINLVYYLDKEVDTERLVRALRQAVKRHPYIQSRLRQTEDGEIVLTDGSEEEVTVETATRRYSAFRSLDESEPSFAL